MTIRSDEQYRHECEVRQVLQWRAERGSEWVRDWLGRVEKSRGKEAADRLRNDARREWERGNRGIEQEIP